MKMRWVQFVRRGFTMLELTVLLLVMGVVAVTVLPSVGLIDSSRRAAAANEVALRIEYARDRARAEGRPFGIEIDVANERVRILTISAAGAAPSPATDVLGQEEVWVPLSGRFAGAAITSFTNGRDGGSPVVWFSAMGVPEIRSSGGVSLGEFTRDAAITMSDGQVVSVARVTGRVAR